MRGNEARGLWINIAAVLCIQLHLLQVVDAGKLECCRHIPNKSKYTPCKDSCDQAWMSSGPLQQVEIFSSAYRHCPVENLLDFWECVGNNYQVLTDIETWEGRACCELAYSSECKVACQSATGISSLDSSCSAADETLLYSCARKQKGSAACCHNVYSTQCKAACRAMFTTDSPSNPSLIDNLQTMCTSGDSYVNQCVRNWTQQIEQTTPTVAQGLKCCDQGSSSVCKQTCIQALTSLTNQTDIVQTLIPVCGRPVSTDPLWQCFLLSESPQQPRDRITEESSPMDGASVQCCSRAMSSQCKSLCIQLYNQRLSSVWEGFSAACQYNHQESAMMECIQEVEEPCQVGCGGLGFCQNFNHRVTGMFRMCNRKADNAARMEYTAWRNNRYIQLPSSLRVPIKDIKTCEPDMWKAISCALNIKPCNANSSSNKICKSDCMHILEQCVDDSSGSYNIGALCDQLPVNDNQDDCISLSQFIDPVSTVTAVDLSNPCVPHPCNETEVCEVNRNYPACHTKHRRCEPYTCRSGCPVGDTSPLIVRSNHFVRMADISSASPLSCQKICKCGHNGFLIHCESTYCDRADSCIANSDTLIEHAAVYEQQCNECICHSSENVCTRRHCPPPVSQLSHSTEQSAFGLPCSCSSVYEPVCTVNGRVLGNACLAQCMGYGDVSYATGNCASRNPCGANSCPTGSKCVPERKTCLSLSTNCPQHRCVPAECNSQEHGVVCDTNGSQHPNICVLLARRKHLAYVGHCKLHCKHESPVCGANGETYVNECAAFAASVSVDYNSPCIATPDRRDKNSACSHVKCDRKLPSWCEGVIPPGACCPVCGTQISTLYSQLYVDKIIQHSALPYLTTRDMALNLQLHLSNRHCDVYTYISYENEFILLILPINSDPSTDEVQFCNVDAHRIYNMIRTKSPVMSVDVKLSILLKGSILSSKLTPQPSITSGANSKYIINTSIVLLTLLLTTISEIT